MIETVVLFDFLCFVFVCLQFHHKDYSFGWHENGPTSAQDGAVCKAVKFL